MPSEPRRQFPPTSRHDHQNSQTPIHVRIGIHVGEPVAEGHDLFGSAVQMAARICDIAQADAILVSSEVRDACTGADLVFEPTTFETLKGFSKPVQLFSPLVETDIAPPTTPEYGRPDIAARG
jgi:class 3 adenylate cyclase